MGIRTLKTQFLFHLFTASATTTLRADALAFLANIPLPFEIPADRIEGKYLNFLSVLIVS